MGNTLRIAFLVLGVLSSSLLWAQGGGGGGTYRLGNVIGDAVFSSNPDAFDPWELRMNGGEGFGINHDGVINGGFGISLLSEDGSTLTTQGGFGGVISGQELQFNSFFTASRTRLGVGGLKISSDDELPSNLRGFSAGTFAMLGQFELEGGLTILPWFRLSGVVGMTGVLGLSSKYTIEEQLLYFPHMGLRFMFGGFPQ